MRECTGSDWVDFILIAVGLLWGCLAAGAWFRPDSPFMSHLLYDRYPTEREASRFQSAVGYTRENMGPVSLWSTRVFATVGMLLFGGIGIGLIVSGFTQCGGLNLPTAEHIQVGLSFRYWPPMLLFIAGALAFATYYLPKIKPERQAAFVVLVAGWSFAGSEAAAFHVGPIANTWGLLAFAVWIIFALGTWRWRAQQ